MHVGLVGKKRCLSLEQRASRPCVWVACREPFVPRLNSSAGSSKRRRRVEPEGSKTII